jgi:hypothetical protein
MIRASAERISAAVLGDPPRFGRDGRDREALRRARL